MGKLDKLLAKILSGTSDTNLSFSELCNILQNLGFEQRIRGDHHIYTRHDIEEIINLQPKNGKAKPYQVKQVRHIILRYELSGEL